jgi:hypothetical protein
MKKTIILLSVVGLALICSCKRTYNCVCTNNVSGRKGIARTTILKGPGVFLKSSVKKDCEKLTNTYETCKLERD